MLLRAIAIPTAARCSFPRSCSHLGGERTLATRRATTDTRGHGKDCSAIKPSPNISDDTDTDATGGWPHPIYASARTEAKKSIFVAHASRLPSASPASLRVFLDHLTAQPALKRATHCMYAWRVVSDTSSDTYTPTSSNPSAILTGQNDGGENGAGERLARLLEATGCVNVVIVVSRWYGGVNLGSERWKMISGVAKDALARGDFQAGKGVTGTDTTFITAKGSGNKKKRKK